MDAFIARQPIFAEDLSVFAYELLFRSSFENTFGDADPNEASSKVIADSSLIFDLERLVAGRRAFINMSQDILVQQQIRMLPNRIAAVEILETVRPAPEVVDACRSLKDDGYLIVLDDFVYRNALQPLVDLADIIKIDLLASPEDEQRRTIDALANRPVRLLAEKVETQEALEQARMMGYTLFQGYFFCRPDIVTRRDVPGFKLNYLRILQQINRPELDFGEIETVIKQEMSLSYRLLRYLNSTHFSLRHRVESIHRALTLLGEVEIKKWASMTALASMAEEKPDELVVRSVVRGRLCENLAATTGMAHRSQDLFLMGLFSLLDAILDRPLGEILVDLPLPDDVAAALTGRDNPIHRVFDLVQAQESADWPRVARIARNLDVDLNVLPSLYLEAVQWADQGIRHTHQGTHLEAARP